MKNPLCQETVARPPRVWGACAIASLAFALSACGGGSSGGETTLADASSAASTPVVTGDGGGSDGGGSDGGGSDGVDQPPDDTGGGGGGDGTDPRDDDSELGDGDANLPGEIRFTDAPANLPIVSELPSDGRGGYLCEDVRFVGNRSTVIYGSVRVPEGKTCVLDTVILSIGGKVSVERNASLYARKLWLMWGSVLADRADKVLVESSYVLGNISLAAGGQATVRRNYAWDIRLGGHTRETFVLGNRAWDDVELHNNLGGVWILNNRIGDALDCTGNANPVSGSNNAIVNENGTGKLGQCAGM